MALIILVAAAIPISIVALFVMVTRLRRQVESLEARLRAQSAAGRPSHFPQPSADEQEPTPPDRARGLPEPPPETEPETETEPDTTESEAPSTAETGEKPHPPVWPTKAPPRPSPAALDQAAAIVRQDRLSGLANWLRENWFYAISAVSLALAGLFLVQYGIDNGYLPPRVRVIATLIFGAALVGSGETVRRRYGDTEDASTAYIPSIFSGAGIVTLFGAILASRLLYDFISPGSAIFWLAWVSAGALLLGWLHGPLLATVGLVGAFLAPFIVGGTSETPEFLYLYFAVTAALGLGIDTVRRWAWVSVLTMTGALLSGIALFMLGGGTETLAVSLTGYAAALIIMAVLIPVRSFLPTHQGPGLTECILNSAFINKAAFPVHLAAGTATAGTALIMMAALGQGPIVFWTAALVLCALGCLALAASARARPLTDFALLPAGALLLMVGDEWFFPGLIDPLREAIRAQAQSTDPVFQWDITGYLLLLAVLGTVAAGRSLRGGPLPLWTAGLATLLLPVGGLALDVLWHPADLIGTLPWAFHALAASALMTVMAERFSHADSAQHLRMSMAVLSALSCIAFALGLVLTETALTLALAVTVVAAAALDRRFDLPLMEAYIAAGVVGLGYRLIADPGLDWAYGAPLWEVALAYVGVTMACVAARQTLPATGRTRSGLWLESAAWSAGAITASVLLFRVIEELAGAEEPFTHWAVGLQATVWFAAMLALLERSALPGPGRTVRRVLTGIFAVIGAVFLGLALGVLNPVISRQTIHGVAVLNTLAVAYLGPAAVLAAGALRQRRGSTNRRLLAGVAIAVTTIWATLAIRHIWQGQDMRLRFGVSQPELYSYTIALLLTGATLFYQSLARHSDLLRRAGLVVIGLAVAKVFLIDISGLQGLTRVLSFLVLGLALAGLAWLDRWASDRFRNAKTEQDG